MQDLTLVGVHEDGEHVLLAAADGQRFRLRVDEALRAAVRRDRPRLGQLQIQMDGKLRPRDIQARIRAGHSAEEVAEAAGLPVEHVRRYEGPVLAERAHVATQARRVVLRRAAPDAPTLGEFVAERLAHREVDADAAVWDAWRTDEGLWTVQVTFTAGTRERHARWAYDPRVRHVTALDDEARWLTEPDRQDDVLQQGRRLAPVAAAPAFPAEDAAPEPAEDDAVHVDLTVEQVVVTVEQPAEPEPPAEDERVTATVDLLDTLRARRGRRTRPVAPREDEADGDPLEDLLGSLLSRAEAAGESPAPEPLNDPGPNHPARRRRGGVPGVDTAQALAVPEPAEPEQHAPAPRPAPPRKNRRASVPSWDDIMFGAKRE